MCSARDVLAAAAPASSVAHPDVQRVERLHVRELLGAHVALAERRAPEVHERVGERCVAEAAVRRERQGSYLTPGYRKRRKSAVAVVWHHWLCVVWGGNGARVFARPRGLSSVGGAPSGRRWTRRHAADILAALEVLDLDFSRSRRLLERLEELVPGGCHTYAKGRDQYPELSPAVISHGRGCHVWDVDGNEFIEYGMGLRAVTLGHAYEPVIGSGRARLAPGHQLRPPVAASSSSARRRCCRSWDAQTW